MSSSAETHSWKLPRTTSVSSKKCTWPTSEPKPGKTIIFPKSADISGWVWEKGRFLKVSPHRRSSLLNTKEEDIKTVRDMRSFVGLYKTLHIATPAMLRFITPLEDTVQGLQSKDKYVWDHAASQRFREAKSHIKINHTLYLPHPTDQLVIKPDGAGNQPGIGLNPVRSQ